MGLASIRSSTSTTIEQRADVDRVGNELPDASLVLDRRRQSAREGAGCSKQGRGPFFCLRQDGQGYRGSRVPRGGQERHGARRPSGPTTILTTSRRAGTVSWAIEESGHSQTGRRRTRPRSSARAWVETVKPLKLFQTIIQSGVHATASSSIPSPAREQPDTRCSTLNRAQGRDTALHPDRAGASRSRRLLRAFADRRPAPARRDGDWVAGEHEPLGGGYRFWTLDKKVDADALLSMEREELADTVIASHFDATSRRRDALVNVPSDAGYKYLVAQNADAEGFFLIWNGAKGNTDFTEDAYEACAKEAKKAGLAQRYHVYARLYRFQTSNVVFYQIPDRILMDFGLDLRGEPYHDDDES